MGRQAAGGAAAQGLGAQGEGPGGGQAAALQRRAAGGLRPHQKGLLASPQPRQQPRGLHRRILHQRRPPPGPICHPAQALRPGCHDPARHHWWQVLAGGRGRPAPGPARLARRGRRRRRCAGQRQRPGGPGGSAAGGRRSAAVGAVVLVLELLLRGRQPVGAALVFIDIAGALRHLKRVQPSARGQAAGALRPAQGVAERQGPALPAVRRCGGGAAQHRGEEVRGCHKRGSGAPHLAGRKPVCGGSGRSCCTPGHEGSRAHRRRRSRTDERPRQAAASPSQRTAGGCAAPGVAPDAHRGRRRGCSPSIPGQHQSADAVCEQRAPASATTGARGSADSQWGAEHATAGAPGR
mmetsp:Transcript_44279/g.137360  ORF Transcript_44279/g.137360 Transcript_44279/m.137360 type:complete len:351 (-) Transcript_44279:625-1677(-)